MMERERAWLLGSALGEMQACDEPNGWPEFEITLRFYVSSDDQEVHDRERKRVYDAITDAAIDVPDAVV